jgi:hypothetical protein
MAITQAICTSFKQELMVGTHNLTNGSGHTMKIALFSSTTTPALTLDAATTAYSTTGEVVGTGYSAGGNTLVNVTPLKSGTTAYTSFNAGTASTTTWSTSTINANGALIYNSTATPGTRTLLVLSFGSDKVSTAGDFSIVFPTNDSTSAIIRIA